MDGRRLLVRKAGDRITGINRLGLNVGLPEPLYQLHQRDQVVMPSALDRLSRELLIRAQTAISSALDSDMEEAVEESPDILAEPTLRWHEWQIASTVSRKRQRNQSVTNCWRCCDVGPMY